MVVVGSKRAAVRSARSPASAELRETGISVLGAMPWSTHVSLFYETTDDLLDTIVPFFAAGLRGGEMCIWLPSKPEMVRKARASLRKLVPDFERQLERGAMQFISHERFYKPDGLFDADDILRRWRELGERAERDGYAGLRGSGDLTGLGDSDWGEFAEYEKTLHASMRHRRSITLCTYPIALRRASDLLDSARVHHLVIARRRGKWDVTETPSLKQTKEQIQRANEELERRVDERTRQLVRSEEYLKAGERLSHSGSFGVDVMTDRFNYLSAECLRMFGFDAGGRLPRRSELMERIHPDDRPRVEAEIQAAITERRDTESEYRVVHPGGRTRYLHSVRHPILDDAGRVVELLGTAVDVTEHKRAADKLARARRTARERAMEARFAAALEERTRLAREIHDSLLQGVTGIALQLRATLPRLRESPAADAIRGVVELAETTIRDARRAVWDMRAPSLVEKGLVTALEEASRRVAGNGKLEFQVTGPPRALPADAEDTIFRVGQEATLNAVKHASPGRIDVKLAYKPREVTLTVGDDGRGFKVGAFGTYAGRWGLLGMRERAERIGASLTIRSRPGRGTRVELRVPAVRRAKAAASS